MSSELCEALAGGRLVYGSVLIEKLLLCVDPSLAGKGHYPLHYSS